MHGPFGKGGGEPPFLMNVDQARNLLGGMFHLAGVRAAYFALDAREVAIVGRLIVGCCLRVDLKERSMTRTWFGMDDQGRPLWQYRCHQSGAGLLVCEDDGQEFDGVADFDLGPDSTTRPNMTVVTEIALSVEQVD